MEEQIFSGQVGTTRAVTIARDHTVVLDIPTLIQVGLLERVAIALERIEVTQDAILVELKKHTMSLKELETDFPEEIRAVIPFAEEGE